jgi:hypothetical protein
MADAQPDPEKIRAEMGLDGAQAVMAGMAAALLDFQLTGGEVELVVENYDIIDGNLEELGAFGDGLAGEVHEGLGFQEKGFRAAQGTLRQQPVEFASEWCTSVVFGDAVDGHEAYVVPGLGVLGAGVSEADEQAHGDSDGWKLLISRLFLTGCDG